MNSKDDRKLSDRYRRTPRVGSPQHLDRRILQTAHQQAPARPRTTVGRWAPMVATACMAGLALYVATPLLETTPKVLSRQQGEMAEEQVGSATESKAERGVERRNSSFADANDLESGAETAAASASVSTTATQSAAQKPLSAQARKRIETETRGDAASINGIISSREADEDKEQAADLVSQGTARLGPEEIARRLAEIRTLASQSLEQQAQRLLDELIRQCAECDLPASLAELRLNKEGNSE